jgi:hypothetical protein
MDNLSGIVEKIKKLQAKANDSATTEAEAMLFAAKVQELLTAHNLDGAVLDNSEEDEKANIIEQEQYGGSYQYPWRGTLAHQVGKLYFCKVFNDISYGDNPYGNRKKTLTFVGKKHNRAIAISMFQYLDSCVSRLARAHYNDRSDLLAFERGCGLRLAARVAEKYKELNNRYNVTVDSRLPVLYKTEMDLVDAHLQKLHFTTNKRKYDLNSSAAREGARAGDTISLDGQISGSPASQFLLR